MKDTEKTVRIAKAHAALVLLTAFVFTPKFGLTDGADHSVVVREAQSLQQIVENALQSAEFAKQIATYNGLDAVTTIVPTGATIRIPQPYMQSRDFGRVVFAKGNVIHTQPSLVVNPPVKGAYVYKGDEFTTGVDGFVSLKFSSGAVVSVQPESRVSIEDIECADQTTSCIIAINAAQGEVASEVTPRPDGQPPIEFTVTTPFLSAAVRGTAFYVDADEGADRIGVTEGLVASEVAGSLNQLPEGKGLLAKPNVAPEVVDLLTAPDLLASEESVIYSNEDAVRWKLLDGAESYRLTIATDESLSQALSVVNVPGNALLLPEIVAPGTYYLSLAGIDSQMFVGLPTLTQFSYASIDDEETIALQIERRANSVGVSTVDFGGTVELLISNGLENPTDERRVLGSLSDGLVLALDSQQDWVFQARKVFSNTSVSVYSNQYFLEAVQ